MGPAIALYESFGFKRTEPYHANPIPDVIYFRMGPEPNLARSWRVPGDCCARHYGPASGHEMAMR